MLRLKKYKVGPVGQGVICDDFRLRDGIGWGGVVTETSDIAGQEGKGSEKN